MQFCAHFSYKKVKGGDKENFILLFLYQLMFSLGNAKTKNNIF